MFRRVHSGMNFREFVVKAIESKRARTYLEVGVRDGATMSLIDCDSVGVDPFYQITCNPVGKKRSLSLFQETSDEFFRNRDVLNIFGKPFDVAFLDGLHQYEYLLRDFINTEAVCRPDSLIMLDDCLPVNVEMTERIHNPAGREDESLSSWWTGDVWKLVPILKTYRPDLRITLVDTQPTGTVCVTRLDPKSRFLADKYFEIIDQYANLTLDDSMLENFYTENIVVNSEVIMNGFDASIFIGP